MPAKKTEATKDTAKTTAAKKTSPKKGTSVKRPSPSKKTAEDTSVALADMSDVVTEETVYEVNEDGDQVEVHVTTDETAGADVAIETDGWNADDKKALASFKALPAERQKYYDNLISECTRPDAFVKSGSFVLDAILSNGEGIPQGTFIEITSPSGCGKTSLLLFVAKHLCASGYRCAYIDTERGLNANQIESFGLKKHVESRMFLPITTLDTFEGIDEFLVNALNDDTLKFIFIDSLTWASPQSMIDKTSSESQTMAIHARTVSQFLRRFRSLFGSTDKTMFFVAQNRKQFTQYGAQDSAAGGEAQKHCMDIVIKMSLKGKLKRRVKGYKEDIIYGSECSIKTEKNRFCAPFIPMDLTIIFGKGVSNADALFTALSNHDMVKQRGSFYFLTDVNGGETQLRGKDAVKQYISQNRDYYLKLIERLGGIRLVQSGNSVASSSEA